jgi:ABC-type multidrug transport system fused ATPase/permease subunit
MIDRGLVDRADLRTVYRSQTFPTTGYGYVYNLHPELAEKIREAFFSFEWEGTALAEEFGRNGESQFIPITYQEYWRSSARSMTPTASSTSATDLTQSHNPSCARLLTGVGAVSLREPEDYSTMLELRQLTKTYATGDRALRGVDLTIERGQLCALIGPSGAGKSTLLRCVNRLVAPTSGEILLDGENLAALSGARLRHARTRIGMIFQGVRAGGATHRSRKCPLRQTGHNASAAQHHPAVSV